MRSPFKLSIFVSLNTSSNSWSFLNFEKLCPCSFFNTTLFLFGLSVLWETEWVGAVGVTCVRISMVFSASSSSVFVPSNNPIFETPLPERTGDYIVLWSSALRYTLFCRVGNAKSAPPKRLVFPSTMNDSWSLGSMFSPIWSEEIFIFWFYGILASHSGVISRWRLTCIRSVTSFETSTKL